MDAALVRGAGPDVNLLFRLQLHLRCCCWHELGKSTLVYSVLFPQFLEIYNFLKTHGCFIILMGIVQAMV